jgi:hypothetical protein
MSVKERAPITLIISPKHLTDEFCLNTWSCPLDIMREGKLKAVGKEGSKAGNIHIFLFYWQVLLYGLSSRGESIAVHVNDFLPYFWFPAPVHLNERKDAHLSQEDFENVKEHLNQHMRSSLKRTDVSSNQFVSASFGFFGLMSFEQDPAACNP